MSARFLRSASRAAVRAARVASGQQAAGRAIGAAAVLNGEKAVSILKASFNQGGNLQWSSAALLLPAAAAAAFVASDSVHASEVERTFIAIKPDGVQRGLIAEIIARFERKGYKLVAIKAIVPTKEFAEKHYHDLKGRPFFNGLTDFLSSGPVVAMVWEGPGVIKYGRKMIGATSPQASEPGTIRGDFAVVVGRNIIHGSDGPETAKDEIALWFKPEELLKYSLDSHKWVYE